jgi:hypothetical protein
MLLASVAGTAAYGEDKKRDLLKGSFSLGFSYPLVVSRLDGEVGLGGGSVGAGADVERAWTALERSTISSGRVGWSSASPTLRKYLLISDGGFLCAIRFVNYVRGQDASEGSIFSSGQETLTSAYEWARLEKDGNGVRVTKEGKDVVKRTPLFSQVPNSAMKLAPTRWEDLRDIRLDDAKLKWYSFEPKREQVRIPIDQL